MISGKKILAWFNSLLCFVLGHTMTNVCTRCGKVVNLKGKTKPTLEERINGWYADRKALKVKTEEYKGSIKLKVGLVKYELDLAKNTLSRLKYDAVEAPADGKKRKLKAEFKPTCIYIDAMNDDTAIRKANNYLWGIKRGIVIKHVTNPETVTEIIHTL